MGEGKAIDLTSFDGKAIKAWLDSFDTVLFDCDGKEKGAPHVCIKRIQSYLTKRIGCVFFV